MPKLGPKHSTKHSIPEQQYYFMNSDLQRTRSKVSLLLLVMKSSSVLQSPASESSLSRWPGWRERDRYARRRNPSFVCTVLPFVFFLLKLDSELITMVVA